MLYRMLLIRGFKTKFQMGDNNNLFDVTHVVNVAHAHILAANALLQTLNMATEPLDSEKVDGEAFIVTNGSPIYFWDFLRRVWQERGLAEDQAYDVGKVWTLNATFALIVAGALELVFGLFGKVPNFSRIAVRSSAMKRYFNISKIKARLGYTPIVDLNEAIVRGVAEVWPRIEKQQVEASKTKQA
jgi:sterol-4alpha-carboxylate 3-dehydrogenase (decarboxylating)